MTGIFLSSSVPVQSFFFFFYQFYLIVFGGSLASLSLCGLRAFGAVAAGAIDGRMGIIIILFITYCLRYGLVGGMGIGLIPDDKNRPSFSQRQPYL